MKKLLPAIGGIIAVLLCASLCACQSEAPIVIDDAPTTTATASTTAYAVQTGWVDADELIVRDGPGTQYEHIDGLVQDQEVTVIGHEGDWFKVSYGESTGYISAAYVRFTQDPQPMVTRGTARTTATRNTLPPTTTTTTAATTATTATTAAPAQ